MFEFIHHAWSEKYRPQTIADCILPKNTNLMLTGFLNNKQLPNLLLYGPPGTGKCLDGNEEVLVRINTQYLTQEQIMLLNKYKIT